jgi:hypothetical protein
LNTSVLAFPPLDDEVDRASDDPADDHADEPDDHADEPEDRGRH